MAHPNQTHRARQQADYTRPPAEVPRRKCNVLVSSADLLTPAQQFGGILPLQVGTPDVMGFRFTERPWSIFRFTDYAPIGGRRTWQDYLRFRRLYSAQPAARSRATILCRVAACFADNFGKRGRFSKKSASQDVISRGKRAHAMARDRQSTASLRDEVCGRSCGMQTTSHHVTPLAVTRLSRRLRCRAWKTHLRVGRPRT